MLLLHVENTKSPYRARGDTPLPHPPPARALRAVVFLYSYENTDFLAKILIFRCKNTEIVKSNLAALGIPLIVVEGDGSYMDYVVLWMGDCPYAHFISPLWEYGRSDVKSKRSHELYLECRDKWC